MPIDSIGAYVPTMQEFMAHWANANAALGGTPATDLTLRGGYGLTDLTADRAALVAAATAIAAADNVREIAAAERDMGKNALLMRLSQFRAAVRYLLDGTAYARVLPTLPPFRVLESRFLRPFDDMRTLWTMLDALAPTPGFTPPLTLPGNYARADFLADLDDMRARFRRVREAEEAARLERRRRDALLPHARARLRQYREAVLARFGPDAALTLALPALSPPHRPKRFRTPRSRPISDTA